jgi:hypothetical protein
MVCLPMHLNDSFSYQSLLSLPVYGIVLLQLLGAAADSLAAYGGDAIGWGQPDIIEMTQQTVTVYEVAINLPTLIDALSMSKLPIYRYTTLSNNALKRDFRCNFSSFGESSRFLDYTSI